MQCVVIRKNCACDVIIRTWEQRRKNDRLSGRESAVHNCAIPRHKSNYCPATQDREQRIHSDDM